MTRSRVLCSWARFGLKRTSFAGSTWGVQPAPLSPGSAKVARASHRRVTREPGSVYPVSWSLTRDETRRARSPAKGDVCIGKRQNLGSCSLGFARQDSDVTGRGSQSTSYTLLQPPGTMYVPSQSPLPTQGPNNDPSGGCISILPLSRRTLRSKHRSYPPESAVHSSI